MKKVLYTIFAITLSLVFAFTLPACTLNKQAPAMIGNANPLAGNNAAAGSKPEDSLTPTPTPTPPTDTTAPTTTTATTPDPAATTTTGAGTATTTPGTTTAGTTTTTPGTTTAGTTTTTPGTTTAGTTTPGTAAATAAPPAAAPVGPSPVALSGADAAAAAALATGLALLETPTLSSPERGATVDSHNVKFEWNPVAGPADITYSIFVVDSAGNSTNDATGITDTSITLTLYDEIYSWYVVATDPTGALSLPSDTWYFLCAAVDNAPPDLSVTSPNGGEEIEAESYFAITWYVLDDLTPTPELIISIFFSYDNGEHFQPIVENIKNKGAFNWHVPNIETDEALIKVTATDSGDSSGGGDGATATATATASGKGVNKGGVNGGGAAAAATGAVADPAAAGTAAAVTGKGGVNSGGVNGGGAAATAGTAADAATAATAAEAAAGAEAAAAAGEAGATGGGGGSGDQKTGQDVSDATFTIVKNDDDEEDDLNMVPDITVTSPNGGEEIEAGDVFAITWATLDQDFTSAPELKIRIFLSVDAGEHFEKIAELDHNPQAFAWHVPQNINTDLALIRITDTDRKVEGPDEDKEKEKTGQDVSDATFEIVSSDSSEEDDSNGPPDCSITSPNGGEELTGGSVVPIAWYGIDDLTKSSDFSISLSLSTDAGVSWQTIASNISNFGAAGWLVPNITTTSALIRMTVTDRKIEEGGESSETSKTTIDVSDAPFSITADPTKPLTNSSTTLGTVPFGSGSSNSGTASAAASSTDGAVSHSGTDGTVGTTSFGTETRKGTSTDVATKGLKGLETLTVGAEGKTEKDSHLEGTGADGLKHGVDITAGTKMKSAQGGTLDSIGMAEVATKLETPSGTTLVEAQDLTPNGSTFDPPITVTLAFDPAKLPAGTTAKDLTMGFWDGPKFVALDATLNADGKSMSAKVSHFTVFGLLAAPAPKAAVPTVTVTVTPQPVKADTQASVPVNQPLPPVTPAKETAVPAQTVTVTVPAESAPAPATNTGFTIALIAFVLVAGAGAVILMNRRRS